MATLTKRQQQIYNFVEWYIDDNYYAPTLQEIADFTNTSKSNIKRHIDNMRDLGYITFIERKSRTIKLIKRGG